MIRIPRFFGVLAALALLGLVPGCASVPQNTEEARDFAHRKFEVTEFRRPAKERAVLADKLRAFAEKCIPETVVIHHRVHPAGETGDTFLHFRTTVVTDASRAELFIQKDLGSMANLPEGGMFFFYAEALAGKGPDFPVRLYWMDSYAFRGQNIAQALQANLTKGSASCPSFNPDPDNL